MGNRAAQTAFIAFAISAVIHPPTLTADWPRFKGPNGSGVSSDSTLPQTISIEENVTWKIEVPPGVSSPIVIGNRIFLTALDTAGPATICVSADTGETLWKRTAPQTNREQYHPRHGPATPTPVSDGETVYVFLPDFGLLAYTQNGDELWRTPLPRFTSVQGMASSPIFADGKIVLLVDQTVGAYVAAYDATNGKEAWRVDRPTNFLGGYSTPIAYHPTDDPTQIIVAASVELTSYQLSTGEVLWSNPGWIAPAGSPTIAGGILYASEPKQTSPPPFSGMKPLDSDGDGTFSREEAGAVSGLVYLVDRVDGDHGNGDGKVELAEWNAAFSAVDGQGGLRAIDLNAPDKELWSYGRSLPALSSVLVYDGLLYAINETAVLTAIDAATGEVVKKGRIRDALGEYSASPVAAGGYIYFSSLQGKLSVVKAGRNWEVVSTTDLGERIQATPAISDGALFVRSETTLWRFDR